MKRYFVFLLLFSAIFCSISCEPEGSEEPRPVEEEIIEIPDEHFKNALVNTNSIDTNGDHEGDSDIDLNNDGEIQRSEAELIEGLVMEFGYGIKSIVDLTGIENFINLQYLKIAGNGFPPSEGFLGTDLINYDFTALKKLRYLELNNTITNYIDALKLTGLSNLAEVKLLWNRPYLDDAFNEENIRLSENFMNVQFEGNSSLTELYVHNSHVNINFCQVPTLKRLEFSYLEGGEPEVFDFHCLTQLEWLDISDNHIESLILKNTSVLDTLLARDIGYGEDGFANYYYLEYICIDDIPEEYEQIATLRDENTVVVTDCSF